MTSSDSVVLPMGRSMSLPLWKVAPARTRATRWGAFTARHRDCAASMSLNATARPAAREPGPLVTLLRCRTVAKRQRWVKRRRRDRQPARRLPPQVERDRVDLLRERALFRFQAWRSQALP